MSEHLDPDSIMRWSAVNPIVLPRGNSYVQWLIDTGRARRVVDDIIERPNALAVQPMHTHISAPIVTATIRVAPRTEYVPTVPKLGRVDVAGMSEALKADT